MKRGDGLFCWNSSGFRYYFDQFILSKQYLIFLAILVSAVVEFFARNDFLFTAGVVGLIAFYLLILVVLSIKNDFQYIIDEDGIRLFKNSFLINAERYDEIESVSKHPKVGAISFYRRFIDGRRVQGKYKMNLVVCCPKEHFGELINFVKIHRKKARVSRKKK